MFIDTHVHLNDPILYPKIDEVIKEAIAKKVNKFFIVGYNLESSKLAIKIAKMYDNCYAIIGFHPSEIKGYTNKEYDWLLTNATKENKVIAIGECGFDFHWDTTTKEEQLEAFIKQIEIAKKCGLPLSIHSRDANQITYDTLKENNADLVGGVMHSYAGSTELAYQYIKMNFIFGISGPLTYKNSRVIKDVVKNIPLENFVTETDSPYLPPEPYRGKENRPCNIPIIAEHIANIKNVNIDDVTKKITETVFRVFGV